jgi:hypothetical protein
MMKIEVDESCCACLQIKCGRLAVVVGDDFELFESFKTAWPTIKAAWAQSRIDGKIYDRAYLRSNFSRGV